MARLTIPQGKCFSSKEVRNLLELESLPAPSPKTKRKSESKAKLGKRIIKNTPATLGEKKVKLPPTSFRRPGLVLPRLCKENCIDMSYGLNCTHTTTLPYKDFSTMSKFVTPGTVTIDTIKKAQHADSFVKSLKMSKVKTFKQIDGVLFKVSPQRGETRLVLPTNLLDSLIVSKHFSVLGLHHSRTRIRREITQKYFVDMRALNKKLANLTSACVQCQFNSSTPKQHILKQSNLIYTPRVTWAVDIIPSMSKTTNGSVALFVAVDMFTGLVKGMSSQYNPGQKRQQRARKSLGTRKIEHIVLGVRLKTPRV